MLNERVGAWELPERWEWHTLGDVCEINPRKPSLERDENAPTSFVPMAALDEERGAITDMQVKPYDEVNRGYTYFEDNDVLFAKITPCMENGKSAIARGLIDGIGFGSTEFHRIRPGGRLIPEWVHLFVRQQGFRDEAAAHFRGSVGQQRVPKEFLQSHPIPVPPTLETQRRIVAGIEELFARIEEARRLQTIASLDIGRLLDAVTQEVLEGLECVAFETLVEDYRNGIYKPKRFYGRGYPSVRMYNIADGQVNTEGAPLLDVTPDELDKFGLLPGDILVNRVNSRELVGKTGLVGNDLGPCTYESKNIRVRVNHELIAPAFAVIALNSPQVKQQVQRLMKPAIGQATINQGDLDSYCIPFTDLSDQLRIIDYLGRTREKVASLRRASEVTAVDLNGLEQSILARAFRGEL